MVSGPKWPAGLTPKVANIIPGSPIALEGMPADGLLAGVPVTHPSGSTERCSCNMEDEGLNVQRDWISYSISLPMTSYFLFVPPGDCRDNIVGPADKAQEKSMKQEGRG